MLRVASRTIVDRTERGLRAARGCATLLDWRIVLLGGITILLTLLFAQVPFSYAFQAGLERGPQSDLPFLDGFYPPEGGGTPDSFRWTYGPQAVIAVPGIGQRGVIVDLDIVSHRAQWDQSAPPTTLMLQPGDAAPAAITLRREGAHYLLYMPPQALDDGALRMRLGIAPWQKPGDNRDQLGIALGRMLRLTSVSTRGVVLPDLALWLLWPLGLALLWPALRLMGFTPRLTLLLLLPLAVVVPLLTLLDAPRMGFGSLWALQAGALSLLAAALSAWLVPPLLSRLGALPSPAILRWLLLLIVISFALKYGGRLYPDSMPGDIGLHINRYRATVWGQLYIQAQHRGLPFPFPTALYTTLAPLTLTGLDIGFLFQLMAGLFEATTVLLLYLLLARLAGSARLGLLAAATYALTSGGFMITWFAFETHVAAQWCSILLIVVLALRWPHYDDWPTWGLLVLLLGQVFLGHIGLFINTLLLGLLIVPLLWLRASDAAERRGVRWLLGAGLAAGLFALLFYYSGFTGLVLDQLRGVATEGLNGVTERRAIPRATSLWVLWQGGLITHFGFFPVLLVLPGVLLLVAGRLRRSILPALIGMTLLVSTSQALLPFLTLSSITTRWLMFSAWAIAVACALGVSLLWQRGRSARLIAVIMALYVCWLTIGVWIDAMLLRKPPIEPF
jgi:hypothetical protein